MLKPIARARGGIAMARAAKMPGTIAANTAVTSALNTTDIHSHGLSAKPASRPAATNDRMPTKRRMRPGSRATSFVPMRPPTINPMSWAGSTAAATNPRARSSSWNTSS